MDIPLSVKIGKNLMLPHWAYGLVLHPFVIIGDNVKLYQGVTIGRADTHKDIDNSFNKIEIRNNVIFCAGSKILASRNCIIEEGVIVGANSVLLIKDDVVKKGIYVGIPVKRIK